MLIVVVVVVVMLMEVVVSVVWHPGLTGVVRVIGSRIGNS